ncbi:MAG: redoxin domain-containing protein, partial [Vicinamibacterales bacterium]
MRHITMLGLAASVLVSGLAAQTPAQTPVQTPAPTPAMLLKVGDVAPAFSLAGSDGKTHKLSDYKGKAVVLAWFPKAFT